MRFAAGLTLTGLLGFLLLEALKIIMVPVMAWIMGLLAMALKVVLVVMALGAAALVIFLLYRWQKRTAPEA